MDDIGSDLEKSTAEIVGLGIDLDDMVTCGKCGQPFVNEEGEFIPCQCELDKLSAKGS